MQRNVLLALCALACLAMPASAQNPLRPDTMLVADTIPSEARVPRAAFIRALIVPGWGHAYLGETRRAAVYFTVQATSVGMLIKTLGDLGEVQDREDALSALGRDSLTAVMAMDTMKARILSDPFAFDTALARYPGLSHTRDLVRSRKQHRQDWIAYTLFFTFVAAVDAYVTAHLKDFPADIITTRSAGGGMSLGVQLPLGTPR